MNRRRFLKNSAGLLVPLSFGIIVPAKAQNNFQLQQQIASAGVAAAGGGANNVSAVSGHVSGSVDHSVTTITNNVNASTVTAGNYVIVGVAIYDSSLSHNMVVGELTKTAGTSTVGTIVMDAFQNLPAGGANVGIAVYRVPITGTGTLTLTYNVTGGPWFFYIGAQEFTGINATPLGAGSLTNSGGGSNTTETTGNATTTGVGVLFTVISEVAGATWTRSAISGSILHSIATASSTFTGCIMMNLFNSTPTVNSCNDDANATLWRTASATYLTT